MASWFKPRFLPNYMQLKLNSLNWKIIIPYFTFLTKSQSMFPLRYARETSAGSSRKMIAHKKRWRPHNISLCSFQKCFSTYLIHVVPNTDESW